MTTKKNSKLAWKVVETIRQHPDQYDQAHWHCESSHCFAGFVELEVRGFAPNTHELETFACMDVGDGLKVFEAHNFIPDPENAFPSTKDFATQALGITPEEASILFLASLDFDEVVQRVKEIFGEEE